MGYECDEERAGNGTRTRDPNLGKVVLYQLSYSRDLCSLATFCDDFRRLVRGYQFTPFQLMADG